MTNTQTRQALRQQRRALTVQQRLDYSKQFATQFCATKIFRNSARIACYMAADGELDLLPVMRRAWQLGKTVYLPVLNGTYRKDLLFARYSEGDELGLNRYKIPEPTVAARDRVKARQIDVVLTPLVAFDNRGNRLGMGAGYYDRTFAFLLRSQRWIRPQLIGVAYDFQRVEKIDAQAWDVPLQGAATENGLQIFDTNR